MPEFRPAERTALAYTRDVNNLCQRDCGTCDDVGAIAAKIDKSST